MATTTKGGAKDTKQWSTGEENDLLFALHHACDLRAKGDGAKAFLSSKSNIHHRTPGVRVVGTGSQSPAGCAVRAGPHARCPRARRIGGRSPPVARSHDTVHNAATRNAAVHAPRARRGHARKHRGVTARTRSDSDGHTRLTAWGASSGHCDGPGGSGALHPRGRGALHPPATL